MPRSPFELLTARAPPSSAQVRTEITALTCSCHADPTSSKLSHYRNSICIMMAAGGYWLGRNTKALLLKLLDGICRALHEVLSHLLPRATGRLREVVDRSRAYG
eukprot:4318559-Pyramimonas_sp.AAC.1